MIIKNKTYSVVTTNGLYLTLTKGEANETLSLDGEWANGEPLELISDISIKPADLELLADLFREAAKND